MIFLASVYGPSIPTASPAAIIGLFVIVGGLAVAAYNIFKLIRGE